MEGKLCYPPPMNRMLIISMVLLLTACKTPGVDKPPSQMSSETLCFRYASAKDPALGAEIARRNLDCTAILREDPLYSSGPGSELDAAHRMGR